MKITRNLTLWATVGALGLSGALGCASSSAKAPAVEKPKPAESLSVSPKAADPNVALGPIYFDYDRWTLREDSRKVLQSAAAEIVKHPEWGTLTIEGHCDERGSDEYNFALGQRRAAAVKAYLVDLGVPAERFETVSFGEHQPAVNGHDESAWRYNRRSELQKEMRQASQ